MIRTRNYSSKKLVALAVVMLALVFIGTLPSTTHGRPQQAALDSTLNLPTSTGVLDFATEHPAATNTPVAAAPGDACQTVFEAMTKVVTVPHHIYTTMSGSMQPGGKSSNTEQIYAGGVIYVMMQGKWTRGTMTPDQMLKRQEANRQTSKATCSYLRDESVNGEAAAVYSSHEEPQGTKVDSQTFISKSRGLPLRTEIDMDMGATGHMSSRYEYANIKAPL